VRKLFVALVGLASASAFSAPAFGTKHDITSGMQTSPQGVGMMPFFQMMIALGIVIGIVKYILPKIATKLNKRLVTGSTSQIKVEESASFAGGNLYIVSAKGRTLLVSAAQSGVTCLADLTEQTPKQEKPVFMDILEKEQETPSGLYVDEGGQPSTIMRSSLSDDEIQAALDRLSHLGA
jgi:flagellar biogenesis protein FliO